MRKLPSIDLQLKTLVRLCRSTSHPIVEVRPIGEHEFQFVFDDYQALSNFWDHFRVYSHDFHPWDDWSVSITFLPVFCIDKSLKLMAEEQIQLHNSAFTITMSSSDARRLCRIEHYVNRTSTTRKRKKPRKAA